MGGTVSFLYYFVPNHVFVVLDDDAPPNEVSMGVGCPMFLTNDLSPSVLVCGQYF